MQKNIRSLLYGASSCRKMKREDGRKEEGKKLKKIPNVAQQLSQQIVCGLSHTQFWRRPCLAYLTFTSSSSLAFMPSFCLLFLFALVMCVSVCESCAGWQAKIEEVASVQPHHHCCTANLSFRQIKEVQPQAKALSHYKQDHSHARVAFCSCLYMH